MRYLLIPILAALTTVCFTGGYDKNLVEIKTLDVSNEPWGIVKLKRAGNHVKVKYFAKAINGTNVADRYKEWAMNKNIVAFSSGTYMDNCFGGGNPVGLCIDQGNLINENLATENLDGLMVVYATGGIVASNLKDGNLTIMNGNTKKVLNIRGNSYDKAEFISWAKANEATVFQTHLFVYGDKLLVTDRSSATKAQRRFLAVCKMDDGQIIHYIVNLPTPCAILDGATKAFHYLKQMEDVKEVTFMVNLDTGCQDIFTLYNSNGQEFDSRHFHGDHRVALSAAANLLVYYYE